MAVRALFLSFGLAAAALGRAPAQPRLVVDEPVYDFGTVTPDHKVTHRFLLTNAGTADLTLGEPRITCACTTAMVQDHGLAPGASTWLDVTFDPASERGEVERQLLVVSDDPLAPELPVRYRARVLDGVLRSAEDLYFRGLDGAGLALGSVTLRPEGLQPVRLAQAPASPVPWLKVTSRTEEERLRVSFTLDARRLPGHQASGTETVPLVVATPVPTIIRIRVHWNRRGTGSGPAPVAVAARQP